MRVSWSTPWPRLQVPHAEEGLCTWLPEEGSLESLSWVSGRCLLPFLPKEAPVLSVYNPDCHARICPLKVLLLKKLKTTLSGDPNFGSSKLGRMEPQQPFLETSQPKSYFPFGKTEAQHGRIEVHLGCEVFR